ncbi:hypothetical protein ACFV1L_05640 [Kitasatospora sp. NPDC059646]|uniref:hypothetical protein n=1 Tax=Kitasatospora sp. NPDC059646 TaxID=3346893 RepID=UPI0036A82E56
MELTARHTALIAAATTALAAAAVVGTAAAERPADRPALSVEAHGYVQQTAGDLAVPDHMALVVPDHMALSVADHMGL